MSGLDNYDNGTKRTWRGWVWNRIADRLDARPRDATVLYLPGPDDLDRDRAKRIGFRNENIIAVDTNQRNIDRVRATGGIGICADIKGVLYFWNQRPVDAVILDFCGNLDGPADDLAFGLLGSPALRRGTQLCINLMRGRESGSTMAQLKVTGVAIPDRMLKRPQARIMHRAEAWCTWLAGEILEHAGIPYWELPLHHSLELQKKLHHTMKPVFTEYRSKPSGKLTFDTAIIEWPINRRLFNLMPAAGDRGHKKLRQLLAANKAIRNRAA